MIRDKVVELLGWRLGNRKDMATRALSEMVLVQSTVLEGHHWFPWFLQKDLVGVSTAATVGTIALPTDYLGQIEGRGLWITLPNGQLKKLVLGDYEELLAKYPGSSIPEAWCIEDSFIHIFPTPDAVYPVNWRYFARDIDMSLDNVETKWLKYAADLVLACVGRQLAEKHIQNPTLAQAFGQEIEPAWDRLAKQETVQQDTNRNSYMGGEAQ